MKPDIGSDGEFSDTFKERHHVSDLILVTFVQDINETNHSRLLKALNGKFE
jgi:hypothetical protein